MASPQYGSPARLTGPCLETSCIGRPGRPDTICGVSLVVCTAGSIADYNPAQGNSGNCSFILDDTVNNGLYSVCDLTELSGTLKVQGSSLALLYDSSSTISVTANTVTGTNSQLYTQFFVGRSTPLAYSHFISSASALIAASKAVDPAATNTAISSRSTPTSSGSISTSSGATSASVATSASATGNAAGPKQYGRTGWTALVVTFLAYTAILV